MIPPFNELGNLPPGIHPATLDEIAARFGESSEIRQVQMESLRWMVELAVQVGVLRIVLNGSFVTDIMEPNDVDCALLVGPSLPEDYLLGNPFASGFPFLEIAIVPQAAFDRLVNRFFATDRLNRPKGMIEVIQWN
jgi:hypothetical protein